MNSKRRLRAVFLSALLVFACLTAIPAPSEAFPIKWLFYTPTVGDPDGPSGDGAVFFRFSQISVMLLVPRSLAAPIIVVPVSLASHPRSIGNR